MSEINIDLGEPNPKQKLFLTATERHVGFGGARGGGKSHVVRMKAIILACRYAGIKIMIVRKTYPELVRNHINILRSMCKDIARYSDKDHVLKFVNGSTITFQYCQSDSDLDRVQGLELDVLFIDEASLLSEYQIKALNACVRGANDFAKRTYYTMNPNGQGLQFLKRLFIDRNFKSGEYPEDYRFIQSLVQDNKALMEKDPDYIRNLEALPPKLRSAWLEGKWDAYEGQVFEVFTNDPDHYEDRRWTHVIKAFEPPESWRIYRSFDWGFSRPFSTGWWAVDFDGVAYRILEYYGCTETANEGLRMDKDSVFKEIARVEREHPWLKGKKILGVADPAIFSSDGGESIAETASKNGVYFEKGDHQRLAGLMQMQYRLAFDDGYPMMYVFDNCKAFIRTIPLLTYDKHKVEDVDTSQEDHVFDECKYFCMMRPIEPKVAKEASTFNQSPLHQYLGFNEGDIQPYRARPKTIVYREGETDGNN